MINIPFNMFVVKPREAMTSAVDGELARKNDEKLAEIAYPDDEDLDDTLFWGPEADAQYMKRAIQRSMGARPWDLT